MNNKELVLLLGVLSPWALALIVAILRGYSIHIRIDRPERRDR